MDSLATLQAQVAQSASVIDSAFSLISGFQQRLDSAIAAAKSGDNHAALDELSAQLSQHTASLAAAVQANTPSAASGAPGVGPEPVPASTTAPQAAAVDGAASTAQTAGADTAAVAQGESTGTDHTTEPQTGAVSGQ